MWVGEAAPHGHRYQRLRTRYVVEANKKSCAGLGYSRMQPEIVDSLHPLSWVSDVRL